MAALGPLELKIFRGWAAGVEQAFRDWCDEGGPSLAPTVESVTIACDGPGAVLVAVLYRRPRRIPL